MGEIAEMMLDGTLCEGCGEYIGDGSGFPGYCSDACARGRGMTYAAPKVRLSPNARRAQRQNQERAAIANRKHKCSKCGKGFRSTFAVMQHMRDKHETVANDFGRFDGMLDDREREN